MDFHVSLGECRSLGFGARRFGFRNCSVRWRVPMLPQGKQSTVAIQKRRFSSISCHYPFFLHRIILAACGAPLAAGGIIEFLDSCLCVPADVRLKPRRIDYNNMMTCRPFCNRPIAQTSMWPAYLTHPLRGQQRLGYRVAKCICKHCSTNRNFEQF